MNHRPQIILYITFRWQQRLQYMVAIVNNRINKKLSYRRVTTQCVFSVVILPITTQQCRNYLYDKS